MKKQHELLAALLVVPLTFTVFTLFSSPRQLKAPGPLIGFDPCAHVKVDSRKGDPVRSNDLVLITGGSGFIGSHLASKLLELGYRVRVLDSLSTGNILYIDPHHPQLDFVYGDIHDDALLRRAMLGVQGVFHLAAASKVLPSLTNASMATFNVYQNAIGTAKVMEVAAQTGSVKKVVYAGSSTYYGNQGVPFHEEDPFVPTSPYAASKYMGELQLLTYDELYNIPTLILRYFMVYGPRNPSTGPYGVVTGKFVANVLKHETLRIEGTGLHNRDFIHVDDVARATILALQSPLRRTVVNIGSGTQVSVKELANLVDPANQEHVNERPKDLRATLCNTCRAKELLYFEARKEFIPNIKYLIEEGKKKNEFTTPFWDTKREKLENEFPGWSTKSLDAKNVAIRKRLDKSPDFLKSL